MTYDIIKEGENMIQWKYKQLLEAAEDMATALIELNPNSSFAEMVIKRFEEVRDGRL
jgi:hypothetical protein